MAVDTAPQPLNKRVVQEIRAEMGRQRLSGVQLASAIGRTQNWISSRLTEKTPLSLADLEQIARGLRVPVVQFIEPPPRQRRASL
jgi:transcriptional regulator with XRE-family HTH domain